MNRFQKLFVFSESNNLNLESSRNLESATIVLSVQVPVFEEEGEGPPRFYALASGSSIVTIKEIYRTKLDRVVCAANYELIYPPAGATMEYQALSKTSILQASYSKYRTIIGIKNY